LTAGVEWYPNSQRQFDQQHWLQNQRQPDEEDLSQFLKQPLAFSGPSGEDSSAYSNNFWAPGQPSLAPGYEMPPFNSSPVEPHEHAQPAAQPSAQVNEGYMPVFADMAAFKAAQLARLSHRQEGSDFPWNDKDQQHFWISRIYAAMKNTEGVRDKEKFVETFKKIVPLEAELQYSCWVIFVGFPYKS
jgi:hypothetical protein